MSSVTKRVFRSQAREIVYNVTQYMKKEGEEGLQNNVKDPQQRTAEATGIPEKNVRKICAKGPQPSKGLLKLDAKKNPKKKITFIDNFVLEVIKRCIHNFPHSENQLPTVKQLFRKLQTEINYQGSITRLRRILRDLGFCWKKTLDNKKVFIEKMDIRFKRIKYIESIKIFRNDGRVIVYTGETYINPSDPTDAKRIEQGLPKGQQVAILHAASEYGFIPNALFMCRSVIKLDNSDSITFDIYDKWLRTQLIPNLPPNTVIVVGNRAYHTKQIDLSPTSYSKRYQMEGWLLKNDIPYDSSMLKPQLYKLICLNKPQTPTYCIDQTLKEYNHTVLRLPPFHQDLNPIEMAWKDIKEYVVKKNTNLNTSTVMDLVKEKINLMGQKDWVNFCNITQQLEEEYIRRDHIIDSLTDRIVDNDVCVKEEIESDKEMEGEDSNEEMDFGQENSTLCMVLTHEKND